MPGQMRTCQTSVPYFAELIIMSFKCEYCGAHSTDTKTNGEIKENCVVITLEASGPIDLKRDLFKVLISLIFRVKLVLFNYLILISKWIMEHSEVSSLLLKDFYKKYTTIFIPTIHFVIVTLNLLQI